MRKSGPPCCFFLLTRGWGRLETKPPVALSFFLSLPGIFSRTLRFYYLACQCSPGSPLRLFVCLFVCWNKPRKTILRLLCWQGSKPPVSDPRDGLSTPKVRGGLQTFNPWNFDFRGGKKAWIWILNTKKGVEGGESARKAAGKNTNIRYQCEPLGRLHSSPLPKD